MLSLNLTTAFLTIVGLVVFSVFRSLIRAISSPLRSIPGPFLARFTRFWLLHHFWRGRFHEVNIDLHRKYGPIVRIAPNEYSIDDPEAIKPIYGRGTSFTKSSFYNASRNPDAHMADLFSDRDPKTHVAFRRKVANLYSMTSLLKIDESMHECVREIEQRFREFARSGEVIDLQYWLQCYAFDIIGAITIAKRFGFLDAGHDQHDLMSSLHASLVYLTHVGVYPELHRPLYALVKRLGKNGMKNLFAISAQQIYAGQQKMLPERDGFLSRMLILHEQDPNAFTFLDMLMVCAMNVGAGSDSTSVALSGTMWFLIKTPAAMAKLRAEIDEKTANGDISLSERITYQQAQKMPYLQAVIQESLRLHPPPGIPLPRTVPKGGAEIAGQYFPEGTVVGINPWVAHLNREVFLDDAETFRPERWLADKETTSRMEKCFLTFGYGSRTCIGKPVSMIELSTLVPELVRKFDFQLVDPDAELETRNIFFVKQKNLRVKLSERSA